MPASSTHKRAGRPRDPEIDRILLRTALSEMAAHGFTGMSIDRIAEVSGIGKPAIYRRYADKAALAIAALALVTATEGPAATGDLVEDLTRQLLLANGNLEQNGSVPLLGTLLAERERQPQLLALYRERLFTPRRRKIIARLRAAQGNGEVRADADIETASLLLTGYLAASYVADAKVSAANLRKAVALLVDGMRPSMRRPLSAGRQASLRARKSEAAPRRPKDR